MKRRRTLFVVAFGAVVAAGCSALVSYDGYGDGVRGPDGASGADGDLPADANGGSDGNGGNDAATDVSDAAFDVLDGGDGAVKNYALVLLGGARYDDAGVSGVQATVEVARINADGTLGSFAVSTPLPYAEDELGAVGYGSSIFLSGASGSAAATMNPDGGLSAWTVIASPPAFRNNARLGVVGTTLILATGKNGADVVQLEVYRTTITGPVSISGWTATTALPADGGRDDSVVVTSGNFVYALGGNDGANTNADYLYASVDGMGNVGSWTSAALPAPADHVQAVTANGFVILLGGGFEGLSDFSQFSASVQGNGSLGTWQTGSLTPTAHDQPACATHGGFVYLVGGRVSGNIDKDTVSYAPILGSGLVGTWQTTSSLTVPRHHGRAVVVEVP